MVMKKFMVLAGTALCSCASTQQLHIPESYTSNSCQTLFHDGQKLATEGQLNAVSELFIGNCSAEVIDLAGFIRAQRRDKFYSLSSELAELVIPEGTFTPYVLESYERSFLSILMSLSYLKEHRIDDALVELRRAVAEQQAVLFNHGDDPVITLFLAALWDRFDPSIARPEWRRLTEFKELDATIIEFANQRIGQIDQHSNSGVNWKIYGFGEVPDLDWQPKFFSSQQYKIWPKTSYPSACAADGGLVVPTNSWARKIASRYDFDYHPFLFAKGLARLPFGLAYGAVGVSSGAAIGIGGCALEVEAAKSGQGGSNGELCRLSLVAGGALIHKSLNLVSFTLQPDLRHWKKMPMVIQLVRDQASSKCTYAQNESEERTIFIE